MLTFIIVWTIFSLPILAYNIYKSYEIEEMWDVLLYPRLHRFWAEKELTGMWMAVMDIFYTIFFLPAVAMYFSVIFVMIIFTLTIYCVCNGIAKSKQKKK